MNKIQDAFAISIASLMFAVPGLAQNQVWVVGADVCPDTNFQTIQEAIDAAANGDTIVIQPSGTNLNGPMYIDQKSLTIIASEKTTLSAFKVKGDLTVENLLPSQSVTLIGVPIENFEKASFRNNQGSIWIEGAHFGGNSSPPIFVGPYYEAVRIENCASVNLIDCKVTGLDVSTACGGQFPCSFPNAGDAVLILNSEINVYGGLYFGGNGDFQGTPDDGGSTFRLMDSTLNIYSATCFGGTGGGGGAGGAIFQLDDTTSQVRVQGPNFFVQSQAPVYGGPGAANVTLLSGNAKYAQAGLVSELLSPLNFLSDYAVVEGQSIELRFDGATFDLIFLGYGTTFRSAFDPIFMSTIALQPFRIIALGSTGASGGKVVNITVGDIISPGTSLAVYMQAYFINTAFELAVSSPTATLVLDSSYDIYSGCDSFINVDDDAPGDPGPGDPNVSDPLEDGSLAHPFDSVQKALANLYYIDSRILLADGVYSGRINAGTRPFSIESQNGPENCIMEPGSDQFVFSISDDAFSIKNRIKGITFSGCTDSAVFIANISITIEDCIFENNMADNGAGLRLQNSDSVILNCIFRSNSSVTRGGGLYSRLGDPTIANCLFINNSALTGGAMSINVANPIVRGCTFADNDGGGAEFRGPTVGGTPLILENCISWGNTNGSQIGATAYGLEVPYGNIQGGRAGIDVFGLGSVTSGPGFIDVDPLFVDPAMGDYHLGIGSPCIDAGDPTYIALSGEVDIDNDPRVNGVAVDLGADEF